MADVQVLGEGQVRPADTRGIRMLDKVSVHIREVRKGLLGPANRERSRTLEGGERCCAGTDECRSRR